MIQLDTTKRAARMITAGRVTVTFRSPSGQHITLLAKCRGQVNGRWAGVPLREAKVIFIEVPNQGGWNDKVGKVNSRGFEPDRNADKARIFCAKQLLAYLAGQPTATGLEITEEERCGRCGRQLTDPISIARGIGPECYGRETGSEHETKVRRTATAAKLAAEDAEQANEIAAEDAAVIAAERDAENSAQLDRDSDLGDSVIPDDLDEQWARYHEAQRDGTHEAAQREIITDQHTNPGDGRDKNNVPYGAGDWRARKAYAETCRSDDLAPGERKQSKAEARAALLANCSQLTELPGETFEDIFAGCNPRVRQVD